MAELLQRAHDPLTGTGGAGPHDGAGRIGELPAAAEGISVAGTLLEASRLMTELLRYVAPDVHRRTVRITSLVSETIRRLDLPQPWEFEVAARLSQIGCLALPPAMLAAVERGERLTEEEDLAFASHPLVARDLLAEVHRLDDAREMIARQREPCALPGETPICRDRVTIGAQLLRIVSDLDACLEQGLAPGDAVRRLETDPAEYDPRLLAAVRGAIEARDRALEPCVAA